MFPLVSDIPYTVYLLVALLLGTPLVMWATRLSPALAGWRWQGWATPLLGLGWGGIFAVGVTAWLRLLLHTGNYLPIPAHTPPVEWGMLVGVLPFAEELFFRGAVFGGMQRTWSPFWAVTLSAALYTLAHVAEPWLAILFLLGVGYALAFRHAGSVFTAIIAHALATTALLTARAYPQTVDQLSWQALVAGTLVSLAVIVLGGLLGRRTEKA